MKNMRVFVSALLIISMVVFTAACGGPDGEASDTLDDKNASEANEKIKVVTTLFPQYDFVREIAKEKADVSLLLPPGMEAHSYEPSPQDIVNIQKSNIFIYTGEYMEPWAHRVVESTKGKELVIVDTSKGIELMNEEGHHDEHEEEHHDEDGKEEHHHHGGKDPHIWLDPVYAQIMVDNIVEGLVKTDPQNENFYKENGEAYKEKLQNLHENFLEAFSKTKYKKIMYGGHFAFGYFAKRYGLEYISPYSGFAPDAEPTPQRVAELIENMKESGLKVIYYEELIDPKVAKVISEQTGAEMMLLHGAHNVTKEELDSGISYIKIMEDNLEKLKQGLGYNE